jgi:hypothetical protein
VNPNDTTDQRKAAMQEFGFEAVPLDEPGAPTPGRIAERLGKITTALNQAVASGDLGAIANGVAELGRLCLALDTWDDGMKEDEREAGKHLLTTSTAIRIGMVIDDPEFQMPETPCARLRCGTHSPVIESIPYDDEVGEWVTVSAEDVQAFIDGWRKEADQLRVAFQVDQDVMDFIEELKKEESEG